MAESNTTAAQPDQSPILKPVDGHCFKCKEKRTMVNPERTVMKNGRPATKGQCPECGQNLFRTGRAE